MNKLSVWQRLSIVVTLFWIAGGTVYAVANGIRLHDNFERAAFFDCREKAGYANDSMNPCIAFSEREAGPYQIEKTFLDGLIASAVIASGAWILLLALLLPIKWVLAGRRQQSAE